MPPNESDKHNAKCFPEKGTSSEKVNNTAKIHNRVRIYLGPQQPQKPLDFFLLGLGLPWMRVSTSWRVTSSSPSRYGAVLSSKAVFGKATRPSSVETSWSMDGNVFYYPYQHRQESNPHSFQRSLSFSAIITASTLPQKVVTRGTLSWPNSSAMANKQSAGECVG